MVNIDEIKPGLMSGSAFKFTWPSAKQSLAPEQLMRKVGGEMSEYVVVMCLRCGGLLWDW